MFGYKWFCTLSADIFCLPFLHSLIKFCIIPCCCISKCWKVETLTKLMHDFVNVGCNMLSLCLYVRKSDGYSLRFHVWQSVDHHGLSTHRLVVILSDYFGLSLMKIPIFPDGGQPFQEGGGLKPFWIHNEFFSLCLGVLCHIPTVMFTIALNITVTII